jgi:hypothetical protein
MGTRCTDVQPVMVHGMSMPCAKYRSSRHLNDRWRPLRKLGNARALKCIAGLAGADYVLLYVMYFARLSERLDKP